MIQVDPDKIAFTIFSHPIAWYGILFAGGFFIAYLVVREFLKERLLQFKQGSKEDATKLMDRLTLYSVIGTIVGARLFDVFFYAWPYYKEHLLDIFKVWEGGLASHGGAIGVLVALIYFRLSNRKRFPCLTFLCILDGAVIGGAIAGTFIRIGNFINQEIVGKVTDVPWAVRFMHPTDRLAALPRHPVQIYEALFYFMTFLILLVFWKRKAKRGDGFLAGLFFVLVFGFRFMIEWFKESQSIVIDERYLSMGQYLSIPFILLGLYLLTLASNTRDFNERI